MVGRSQHPLFEVEVVRSSAPSHRETQKKVLVGLLVCVLGLTAACAVVAPDGQGISIHGARAPMSHRIVMAATRTFQSLDEEAPADDAPAEEPAADDAAAAEEPAADDAAAAEAPAEEEKKKEKKTDSDAEKVSGDDKIVLLGDEELNVAMQRYYEAHPSSFQWSLWQQIIGAAIAFIAACVLVYSEVNAMLLTRDLDALKAAELMAAPKSIELSQRELWWGNGLKAQWRVIATGSALGIAIIAIFVAFTSECPMLEKLSEKYDLSHTNSNGNCLLLAFLLAILNAAGFMALIGGVTWMCTRPLPGILLIVLSMTSDWFNTSTDYFPVLTWIFFASVGVGAYAYFTMGAAEEEEDPLLNKGPREFV